MAALAAAPSAALAAPYQFDGSEAAFDTKYANTPVSLGGVVVDRSGQPVAGATIRVLAFGVGATNAGRITTTDASGAFSLSNLVRRSVLLKISRTGYYSEIVPVDLQRPIDEATTSAGALTMTRTKAGRARLVFVGDTMFGRRFTDADEDGVQGEAGDLIRPGSRAADAAAIVAYVRDAIGSADYAVANLECAVTAAPDTPHPYKSYTFYSHPDTLAGLVHAGIDGVDLGNNHVFDYLGAGVWDTINAVSEYDLDWTGAEMDEQAAQDTTIRTELRGVPLALQGFSALRSDGSTQTPYLLVARDPDKAGALEASNANMFDFLDAEAGDSFAVPMIHGGSEYSRFPIDSMRARFVDLAAGGAGLVVAHHTHTPHGIGLVDAAGGPRFVLMSLGNFIFDQSTFETTQSMIAVVDVDATPGGFEVARVELLPVHVEDYVPKLLSGTGLLRLARQLGHLSSHLPLTPSNSSQPDGLRGATVIPAGQRALALRSPAQYATVSTQEALSVTVSGGATAPIAYARSGPGDSLAAVKTGVSAAAEYGRDILLYGDFEDTDVDGAFSEGFSWGQTTSRYVQNSVVRSGVAAAVLLRKSSNVSTIEMPNTRTLPVAPGDRLTIRGYVRGDNAGTFQVRTRFYGASGAVIATHDRYTRSAGSYGWTQFTASFTAPTNARDLRIYLRQTPPKSGEGRAFVDDLAVVLWDGKASDAKAGANVLAPNSYDFVRFTGIAAGVSKLAVTLTHRTFTASPE